MPRVPEGDMVEFLDAFINTSMNEAAMLLLYREYEQTNYFGQDRGVAPEGLGIGSIGTGMGIL